MPGFDGTGPLGQGSQTGRGMGYCHPADVPTPPQQPVNTSDESAAPTPTTPQPQGGMYGQAIPMGQGMGQGFGRGMGRGMAMRRGFGRGMGRGFGRGMGRGFGRGLGRNG